MKKQFTIITGASSGIGKELAIAYAGSGEHLILGARNTSKLEETAALCRNKGAETSVLPLDLASEESVRWFAESVKQLSNTIDRLLHVGGISQRGKASETDLKTDRKIMEVNYFGTIALTKAVLPLLLKSRQPKIAVTSSISGKFGFYQRSAYAASKFALHGFFETLRLEHRTDNLSITIVCPGFIKTEISVHALDATGTPGGKMDDNQANGMPAMQCARKMKKAIEKRKKEVYIGGKELIMVHLRRFLPALFFRIAYRIKPTK